MENNNNNQSFWQFSDQLRVENLANLSLNDSIWSTNPVYKDRRNLDIASAEYNNKTSDNKNVNWNWKSCSVLNNNNNNNNNNNKDLGGFGPVGSKSLNLNPTENPLFSNTWKFNNNNNNSINGDFNKGIYSSYGGGDSWNLKNKGIVDEEQKNGKKNRKNQNQNRNKKEDEKNQNARFKTLPAAEALPRNETIGGYIFVCNNDTMEENLKRQLFGLPPRYRDSVRAITPGLPLFLYNYSTHQLHGIYEAASFGGTNIELSAFQDKKCPGESRFPAQVRAITRKVCLPLEEDSFRPILHHYDGPKFRLELTVPEVLSLLDIFADQNPN
ncbi:hypothetical protein AALP_AA6G313400 [Arabis alpina]|uniref:DCD domain-containing protein n=1 Tax=Arabis alpina TaxID=50452 RepID=A0A087GSX2_ARAAL|nr:hypothetical protein AALP_AA6G313400 [Arabis alpina]